MLDFIGPLGVASHLEKRNKVVLVGGGLGVAPVFPQLRLHKELGSYTISIIGFRNKDLMFWDDNSASTRMNSVSPPMTVRSAPRDLSPLCSIRS